MNSKSTVLIVDDETGPRESLKLLLKAHYRVEEADGGLRAMQIIRKRKVDLVTLDLRMPGMDGVAVLKSIKEYNPHIEVMIITGYGAGIHGSAADLVRLGARSYYTKPFNVPQLMVEIAQAIDSKKKLDRSRIPSIESALYNRRSRFRIPMISISSLTRLGIHPTSDILVQDICTHGIGILCPEKFQKGSSSVSRSFLEPIKERQQPNRSWERWLGQALCKMESPMRSTSALIGLGRKIRDCLSTSSIMKR
ncbi:MAG: response regulator [Candidatus Manganitrophus sp.]|nr:MAG: response regulator [Candidatus Manganitrophus sp.]